VPSGEQGQQLLLLQEETGYKNWQQQGMGRTDPKIDSIAPAHVSPEEQWQGQLRRDLYPALPPSLVLPPSQSWLDRTPALHPEGAPAQFIKSPARHSALFLQGEFKRNICTAADSANYSTNLLITCPSLIASTSGVIRL